MRIAYGNIASSEFIAKNNIHYIVHQCNCKTTYALGLARTIFEAYPNANTYVPSSVWNLSFTSTTKQNNNSISDSCAQSESVQSNASTELLREPGSIHIFGPVVNLYGQIFPGRASVNAVRGKGASSNGDSAIDRLRYFKSGIEKLAYELNGAPTTIAFPKFIGCGLAGGDWTRYFQEIKEIENNHPNISVVLCVLA